MLLEVIRGDLVIFNDAPDAEFFDSVSNGFQLVLSLPEHAILLHLEDLNGKKVEVSLFTPWLNVEDNGRLGDDDSLLLGGVVLGSDESAGGFL